MTGYTVFRLIHSYWRWVVLACAIVVLVRSISGLTSRRGWTGGDARASRLFVIAVDVQLLLGLILYFVFSPFWNAMHGSFHAAMKDPITRFFGMEHGVAMLLALVAVHVGAVRARRATDAAAKHRALLITTVIFFALALVGMPWPWRPMGRPLFRLSL
ncbi:MAG: hypothetical protein JWN44_1305 [Myxococcales bacterium]|nr:hypothetical protein [Myxococcales bacterium]